MSKRARLNARAKETARRPNPERLAPLREKRGYRVVAVSLYTDQANWLDQEADERRTKRSTVVQQLIDAARLHSRFHDGEPEFTLTDYGRARVDSMPHSLEQLTKNGIKGSS